MIIREAVDSDADAIRAIYNHYVLNDTCTFDTEEQTLDERKASLQQHREQQLPVLVAEDEGAVVGWASLSRYHPRCGYRTTVEFSVYVDHARRRAGLGKQLTSKLVEIARRDGMHNVVGLICSENTASLRMVEMLGFRLCGELREVGRKFDRWLSVTFVELILRD